MADNLLHSQNYLNWSVLNKFYNKPPLSTPDDPVIHSPPALGSHPSNVNGYSGLNGQVKMEDGTSGACTSPDDSGDQGSEESRRRQKTCRVCGDHATGYNFNVITCESCKAFFRRNALRPKEFKCPYSEDCDINAVSRRFCQKCRLRKCFTVGMKKEWILNEDQLRRRKNSRLNNVASAKRTQQHHQMQQPSMPTNPAVAVYQQQTQRPLSITPMETQTAHHMNQHSRNQCLASTLVSPPGGQTYPMTSPMGSTASDSPPSRHLNMLHNNDSASPEGRMPVNHQPNLPRPKIDSEGKVTLSEFEYKQLLARIPGSHSMDGDEPTSKRTAYSAPQNGQQPIPMNNNTPPFPLTEMQNTRNDSASSGHGSQSQGFDLSSFGMGMANAFGGDSTEEFGRRMNLFYDTIIQRALDSPDTNVQPSNAEGACILPKPELYDSFFPPDQRVNYQLNAAELRALDVVKEAFYDIDDQLEQGPSVQAFLKVNKMPVDILHIVDAGMRRFVRVAKRIPAFHDLTQDGKLSLLKGGMIEMLTIRGMTRYDTATNSFTTPTIKGVVASVNVDDMFAKLTANAQSQKEKCLRFFHFFDEELKKNELAVYLVMCAVLFTIRRDPPMCDSDIRIVTIQHDHFMCLLNRYLTSLYGDNARRLFSRIPTALHMLNDISTHAGMIFMGVVKPQEAADLPKEFFKIE